MVVIVFFLIKTGILGINPSVSHVQEVKELMASGNYDVNAQMEDGNTGLHLAASNGFGEVCYVLQKHYKAKIDIKNQDENVVSDFLNLINTHAR